MHLSVCKMKSWLKYFVLLFCLKFIEGSQTFRCDYKYSSAAEGWFKHVVVPATWFDAQLRCALEGAVLASPTTLEIRDEMRDIINSTNTEQHYEVFTGIHATFSKGAYHTVEGIPLSKIPQTWAPNEPDNKENKESCLTLNSDGDFADLSCEETRPYICYRSESNKVKVNECGTEDPEYRLDRRTNKCYKLHSFARNFYRAKDACAAEGGHLAIINSDTEAEVLSDIFTNYPASSLVGTQHKDVVFIGFYDLNKHGDWRTIQGQTLAEAGYDKFGKGEPNNLYPGQHCGAMDYSGKLDDLFCDQLSAFICERNPDYEAVVVKVKVNECGTVDPEYRLDRRTNKCYKLHSFARNFYRAKDACAAEGGHLAIINSDTEAEVLSDIFTNYPASSLVGTQHKDEVFIGFHDLNKHGDWRTIQGQTLAEAGYDKFGEGEPNKLYPGQHCGAMDYSGKLDDLFCDQLSAFICERNPDYEAVVVKVNVNECGTVDPEYRLDRRTNKCYKFHTVPRNFSRAFLACSAEGGHLAIINSDTEAEVLSDLFSKYPVTSMVGMPWKNLALIGFHDMNEHGDWRTIHGQTLAEAGYGKFFKGVLSPGQHCGAIIRSGKLDDMYCDKLAAFICEKSADYDAACSLPDE